MAVINKTKTLFFVTSPRSPWKFIPEINVLGRDFSGKAWDKTTQTEFMEVLIDEDFYIGSKKLKDPAFSARDRINRAPKAYGFVKLKPCIELTEPGKLLIASRNKEEILLRQLLKFQLPSVYHQQNKDIEEGYWVKPFLEIIRLIRYFGILSFDEIKIFGMQLTNYKKFDYICKMIEDFRKKRAINKGKYKKFYDEVSWSEVCKIYDHEIIRGDTKTRETLDSSVEKFVKTKISNLRDYTDACFRYLRATGCVLISRSGHSLSIAPEKEKEVDDLLRNIDRNPCYVDNEQLYEKYLFNPELPKLYSDDRNNIIKSLNELGVKDMTLVCQYQNLKN